MGTAALVLFIREKAQVLTQNFDEAKKRVADKGLEFDYAGQDEFLIADTPVAAWNKDTDKVGPLQGVKWDDADLIFMPLSPRTVVSLAAESRYLDLDAKTVEHVNVWQVRGGFREVYYRPSSGFDELLIPPMKKNSPSKPSSFDM